MEEIERPFSCGFCEKAFNRKDVLIEHERVHTGEKPFKCKVCDKSFTQRSILRTHEFIHTGNSPYNCDRCGKVYARNQDLKEHIMKHDNIRPFKCKLCDGAFRSKKLLKSHELSHFGQRIHKCHLCDMSFVRQATLKTHIDGVHEGKFRVEKKSRVEKKYPCGLCDKVFSKKTLMKRHEKAHSSKSCFKCDDCEKIFFRKDHLKQHKLNHNERRDFKCNLCEKDFKLRHHLKHHILSHTKENMFNCNICDESFALEIYLSTHMFLKHNINQEAGISTNEQKEKTEHNCDGHLEEAAYEEDIKTDITPATKANDEPFECPFCCKTISFKIDYIKHLKTHGDKQYDLEVSDKTKFKCNQCDKSFPFEKKLKRHLLSHIPMQLKCDLCGKGFRQPDQLRSHMFLHTGQKLYACDICNEVFTDMTGLDEHRIIHVDELPFRCETCPKAYKSLEARDLHLQNNHAERLLESTSKVKGNNLGDDNVASEEPSDTKGHSNLLNNNAYGKHRLFECPVCYRNISSKYEFNKHLKIHEKKPKLDVLDDKLSEKTSKVKVENINDQDGRFEVDDLDIKVEDDELPFRCPKAYKSIKARNVHIKNTHFQKVKKVKGKKIDAVKVKDKSPNSKVKSDVDEHGDLKENTEPIEKFSETKKTPLLPNESNDSQRLFECPVCYLTISLKHNFKKHLKIHEEKNQELKVFVENKFKCNQCHKTWPSEKKLKEHYESHQPMQFKCNLCGKGYRRPNQLRAHMVRHTGLKPYTCDICSKSFLALGSLINHKKIKHNKVESKACTCNICKKMFTDQHKLDEHRMVHVAELPFRCETCPRAYKSRNARDLHIKNHPVQKIKKATVRVKNLHIDRLQMDGLKVKVEGQMSKHKIEDYVEVKTENVETSDQSTLFDDAKEEINPNSENHEDQPHKCDLCERTFAQKDQLNRHKSIHLKGDKFRRRRSAQTDIVLKKQSKVIQENSEEKSLKCDECTKYFADKMKLYYHKLTHLPKKYECDKCGKKYRAPYLLREHMFTHTSGTPYTCDICKKSLTRLDYLIEHKKRVHNQIQIKTVACKICEKDFLSNHELDVHRMVHVDQLRFRCETCPKAYKTKQGLNLHFQEHHGINLKRGDLRVKVEQSDGKFKTEEENKEEQGLSFFCGICEQRITADSDSYDIHIQGDCPENQVESDNHKLIEVPVKFEVNKDETGEELQDHQNDLDKTNQNDNEIAEDSEHQENGHESDLKNDYQTDNESSDEFEIEYENNDCNEDEINDSIDDEAKDVLDDENIGEDVNRESFIDDFKEAVNEMMFNKNKELRNIKEDPLNETNELVNSSVERMNSSVEHVNSSVELVNNSVEHVNSSVEHVNSSVELLNKSDDSLHSVYIIKTEPMEIDD